MAKLKCTHPDIFERVILDGFMETHPRSEAARSIQDLVEGGSTLTEAVVLTIESLSEADSEDLRQAVAEYEEWCEIIEVHELLESEGFDVGNISSRSKRTWGSQETWGFRVRSPEEKSVAVDVVLYPGVRGEDIRFGVNLKSTTPPENSLGDGILKALQDAGYRDRVSLGLPRRGYW